jgi:arylsulfatase A-like enzyme
MAVGGGGGPRAVFRLPVIITALLAAAGLVAWQVRRPGEEPRDDIHVEDVVVDTATFVRDARRDDGAPPALTAVRPNPLGASNGAHRLAVVTPAPGRLAWRTVIPAGARLRFGIGVASDGTRHEERTGLRFAVAVDGREVFARSLNPARERDDRRWWDVDVALDRWGGRTVELTFAVRADEPSEPLAGIAGWSRVRLATERVFPRQRATAGAPSVLVVVADCLRADRLGAYGAPGRSPALDALAARGLVFEQAIAQSSWTAPSVATMLTGLHPDSHGVELAERASNEAPPDFEAIALPRRLVTLAERAQMEGLTTIGVSANPLVSDTASFSQGFEVWHDLRWSKRLRDWSRGHRVNDAFVSWLANDPGNRFFAYLHYMDVHDPYRPPRRFAPPVRTGLPPTIAAGEVRSAATAVKWKGGAPLDDASVAHLRTLYDAEVRSWDAHLEELLGALARLGRLDTTVVVVVADHGEELQEHGALTHGHSLYEELIRVPFVIAGPGVPRGRITTPVQGIDFAPTVGALLGLPPAPELPGQNVLAAFAVRPAVVQTRRGARGDHRPRHLLALRTAGWKLVWEKPGGATELYDLAADPGERENLDAARPAERSALLAQLQTWSAPAAPPADDPGPDLREALRALGYVE